LNKERPPRDSRSESTQCVRIFHLTIQTLEKSNRGELRKRRKRNVCEQGKAITQRGNRTSLIWKGGDDSYGTKLGGEVQEES